MTLRNWLSDYWSRLSKKYGFDPDEHDVYTVQYAMQVVMQMAQGSNCSLETAFHIFSRAMDYQMEIHSLRRQNEQLIALLAEQKGIITKN